MLVAGTNSTRRHASTTSVRIEVHSPGLSLNQAGRHMVTLATCTSGTLQNCMERMPGSTLEQPHARHARKLLIRERAMQYLDWSARRRRLARRSRRCSAWGGTDTALTKARPTQGHSERDGATSTNATATQKGSKQVSRDRQRVTSHDQAGQNGQARNTHLPLPAATQ